MPDDLRDEDCLFVNVFKPSKATPKSKLPVWLYIQGGGYANNGNNNYNGTEVVQTSGGNIVFVNFNYRVGALGFLASEELRKDGALNAGLLDQRKVMHWVRNNIEKVTLSSNLIFQCIADRPSSAVTLIMSSSMAALLAVAPSRITSQLTALKRTTICLSVPSRKTRIGQQRGVCPRPSSSTAACSIRRPAAASTVCVPWP